MLSDIDPLILFFWDFSSIGGNPNPNEESKIPPLSRFSGGKVINFELYWFCSSFSSLFSIRGLSFIIFIPFGEVNANNINFFFAFFKSFWADINDILYIGNLLSLTNNSFVSVSFIKPLILFIK